jgi:hypothetical protein
MSSTTAASRTTSGHTGFITVDAVAGLAAVYEVLPSALVAAEFAHIGGLGMGAGLPTLDVDFGSAGKADMRSFHRGITYHGLEVVDVLLGSGNDKFDVSRTVTGTITVIQGGGNSYVDKANTIVGGDTITVTGGGGAAAPLIVFGDTSQDGTFYNATTAEVNAFLSGNKSDGCPVRS